MVLRRPLPGGARPLSALALALPVLVLAGCGSGSSSGGPAASSPASAQPAAAMGAISASSTSLGRVLVGADGRTLYLFMRDPQGKSSCSGACAKFWPPYVPSGKPSAGSGVDASLLSLVRRGDGRMQAAYDGHPLYLFSGDHAPGDTNGQGLTNFGAPWYVISPNGTAVRSSGSGSSGGSTGGRYGY